ncbi:MAG TPA: glycerol-3-phosphate acyltransferase, partial [Stenomitos sp.]
MILNWMSSYGWGIVFLLLICPLIGGLPLTGWITRFFSSKNLAEVGTRNIGVSAAFYHGGTTAGILAVIAEAAKGIGVVLGARQWLPAHPVWELATLVALVAGRYWLGKGAGTTNAVWGVIAYNWRVALALFLVSGGLSMLITDRRQGRWIVLA